jgi:hypothetical protein
MEDQNEQQKKPEPESKEAFIADLNKLMLLAGDGDEEAFKQMLYERWKKMRQ